jgi:hypothetical protein
MSSVLDEGLALFAGLNVIPKRSFLAEYSSRVQPACYPGLMRDWFDAIGRLGMAWGTSFDLDFHTIPFHGEGPLMEKHYVSKRSRRQKGSWRSWLKMQTAARSATRMPMCESRIKTTKSCASSHSGKIVPAGFPRN